MLNIMIEAEQHHQRKEVGNMKKHILAIDVGTTSMRGILYNEAGKALGMKSIQTPLIFVGDYIEQSPSVYREALIHICRSCSSLGKIDAVTLTAYRSAPTLVDEEGNALTNFIMWQDTRNRHIYSRLLPPNDQVHRITGAGINTVFTGSKITWWKENEPELFGRAYKAMIVPDYLMMLMTGVFATDYTYGSRTSLMNIHTLSWDETMCELFNLTPSVMSDLIPQGSIYGYVTEGFAAQGGLPVGIPVISAGGDQQCGALGLGSLNDSSLVINCGTGSFILGLSNEVYTQTASAICNVSALNGKYVIESNVLASAAALNWFIRELTPDLWNNGSPDFTAFNQLAAASTPGANGIICVPLFQGCGTRDWNPSARASFSNISLSATRADMARALLEGIAAEIVQSIRALPEKFQKGETAFLGGGLTKSDLFDQILADMSGKKLTRYEDTQSTAIGAFISAATTLGIYPDEQAAFDATHCDMEAHVFLPDANRHSFYQKLIDNADTTYRLLGTQKGDPS